MVFFSFKKVLLCFLLSFAVNFGFFTSAVAVGHPNILQYFSWDLHHPGPEKLLQMVSNGVNTKTPLRAMLAGALTSYLANSS